MKKIKVKIEGIRPYLQHRRPSNEEEVKEIQNVTKILQKNPYNKEASKDECEFAVYKNDKGYFIPSSHIQEAMIKAGSSLQVKGQGKKTYKDYMKSYVFPQEEEILLKTEGYILDKRYVKIQKAGILRNRPRFDKWEAEFTLLITDDSLPLEDIKTILETAGFRIGIGDYRPKYGLFQIVEFKEMNG